MELENKVLVKSADGKILTYMDNDTPLSSMHDHGVALRMESIERMTNAAKIDSEHSEKMREEAPCEETKCE